MSNTRLLHDIAKAAAPHLSKLLGYSRPVSSNWRTNYDTIPTRRVFDGVVANRLNSKAAHSRHVRVDLRRPFRILCLDGGGVRGALTTAIISRICDHNPRFLDNIDFICGTSAGGILALLLACGYSAKECEDIYSFAAPHIFPHNPWRVINPFRSKYSDKAKQEILQHYYGDRTMKDLSKTCAVIAFRLDGRKSKTHAMFNIEGWRPAVFSNMPRASGLIEPDSDLQIWDAAMRTSAAPTFFPVFRGYTDGGIVANNPSIIALSKAMAHYPHVNPKNVTLLSIGAGNYPRHTHMLNNLDSNTTSTHDEELGSREPLWRADWGYKQWIPYLLDILLEGGSVTNDMVLHYLLDSKNSSGLYHRIDPQLPRAIALDDVGSLGELRDFARTVDLKDTLRFVDENFSDPDLHLDSYESNSLDSASIYHEAWHDSVTAGESATVRRT